MENQNDEKIAGHPDIEIIGYLENTLAPDDRTKLEEHLKSCPACSEEVAALRGIHTLLTTRKEQAFCPEACELYEFAETGQDPSGRLELHLSECPLCSEEVSTYRNACREDAAVESMPFKVRAAFRRYCAKDEPQPKHEFKEYFSTLLDYINSLLRVPTMSLAMVAAAVLAVVVLIPRGGVVPIPALSQVAWEDSGPGWSTRGIPLDGKPQATMVILMQGFKKPFTQERIDSLYDALRPSAEMKEKYDFLTPAQAGKALVKIHEPTTDAAQLGSTLRKELNIARLVTLTVIPEGDRFGIEGKMMDTETGRTLGQRSYQGATEAELGLRMRQTAFPLFDPETPAK